jgi:hypothetical protein
MSTVQWSLTYGHQVAVVLDHDIPAEVLLSRVQLLPVFQAEVHKHVPESQ